MERDKNFAPDNTDKILATNCTNNTNSTNKSIYYEVKCKADKEQVKQDFRKLLKDAFSSVVKSVETAIEDMIEMSKSLNASDTIIAKPFGESSVMTFNLEADRIVFKTSQIEVEPPAFLEEISEDQYKLVVGE